MENGVRVAKVLLGHYIMNSIIFGVNYEPTFLYWLPFPVENDMWRMGSGLPRCC